MGAAAPAARLGPLRRCYGSGITRNPKSGAVITRNYSVITLQLKLLMGSDGHRHRRRGTAMAL